MEHGSRQPISLPRVRGWGHIAPILLLVGLEKAISASYRFARQIIVLVVGLTVLVTGVVMLVLPGPGLVTIFLGLTILAIEFAWARYWLNKLKATTGQAQRGVSNWIFGRKKGSSPPHEPVPEGNVAGPQREGD